MSLIILNVDEVRRTLSASGGTFVVHDKEVDIVRFAINSGFADIVLDGQVALRVMYQRPGETEVRAQTLTYYDTDGLRNYYDWQLLSTDLAEKGTLTVALCILRADSEVEEWHTTPCQVRVLGTIHTDDSDEADETITPTVAQRVAVLETIIQRVASGAPIVVASTSAMTDADQIYVLSTDGKWYYHNGTTWVSGGTYGAVATDTTLTQSGIPADAKAVGDELTNLKGAFTNNGIKIVGQIASTVTTISSLTKPGLYFIPKTYVGNLTDKPSDMSTENNYALLVLYSAGQKVQQLIADWGNFDTIWDRHKTTSTWSSWNKSKFNGLGPDEQFADRGNIDTSTTSLASVLKPGAYFISSTVFSGISDLPSNIANNNNCVLVCYHIDTRVAQWLWQKGSGYLWMRYVTISDTSATAWAEIHGSKYLVRVDGADANNITWNGFYGWGSTETVYNVPDDVAAGMLCNIMRTATTKYQFGIDYFTNNIYSRNCQLGTWSTWRKLAYSDEIQKVAKPKVKYQSGSYVQGLATEKLDIFIPTQSGYILYRVFHFINTDVSENYNVWRIYQAHRVDDLEETGLTYITTSGEWECAIHLNGRGDFSGGSTHGDEVMTDAVLLVDGLPVTISSLTSMTDFSELRLIRTSHLYDPDDHTTVIADHGVEYIFSGEGLTINQSVNWKVAEQLTRCYLAMFLPSKARIDRMAVNTDFDILELPSDEATRSEPIVKQNGTAVTMWDTGSGVYAEVSIPTYPTGLTGGDTVRIQDNSTSLTVGRYNKLYYTVCEGGSSAIGELWKSTTVYKIGYNGAT